MDLVGVTNLALQALGTRTTIASMTENSNEAIQANLSITKLRDDLLRMAPWNCGMNTLSLPLITAVPGTPENQSPATPLWVKGQPPPPWLYEYQYPVDCLRPCWIVPQFTSGFAGGVPITPAMTGGMSAYWNGPPVKFRVSIDQFFPVISASVVNGGSGYVNGDFVTLAAGSITNPPIGAPVVLQITGVAGGVITSVAVVNQIAGEATPLGGSYFSPLQVPNPQAAASTASGVGTGATFNLTFGTTIGDQRVILTNQESAVLAYVKQVTDVNVMDPLFIDAWAMILAARLAMTTTADKALANVKVQLANGLVAEARKADGNEGLTINNVTPDWLRVRGIYYPTDFGWSPNQNFDWGGMFPMY